MGARTKAALVIAFVVGFGGLGALSADAANPFGFSAVVNPLNQLPSDAFLAGATCTSSGQCVAVGLDGGAPPTVT